MNQIIHSTRTIFLFFFLISSIFSSHSTCAGTGDTTVVHGFNAFLHQNCNSGTGTFAFPADSFKTYKVLLKYQLSCPSFGCDIYDRIATLKVLSHTGRMDSTLTLAPNFLLNGVTADSVWFMNDTSYQYSYNSTTSSVDSVPFPSMQVILFGDSANPTQATDTLTVWPSYYNQYVFDVNGVATDSVAVAPDSMIYYSPDSLYSAPFEILDPVEIARAITPYGMAVDLWFDVSDYKPLLHDSVTLYTAVCGYSNGWLVTTDFYFIEGDAPVHPFKVTNLWNGTFAYGNTSNPIESHLQPLSIPVDTQTVFSKVRLITTGHGFGGYPNQDVAEFYDVTHTFIAGSDTMPQHLWRSDCGLNPLYPQGAPGYTSTWFYKRANWCPGSYVTPHDYNVTAEAIPGDTLHIDYNMQPYTVTGGPSGWYPPEYYIQSQAIFYDHLNYVNNAAILEVRKPNNAFEFNRLNPMCEGSSPEILIKNYGTAPLTSLMFHYGIDGVTTNSQQWTGNLEFLDTISITLPPITFGPGSHSFFIYCDQPNSTTDEYTFDDTLHTQFVANNVINSNGFWIQVKNDGSPNEVSWDIRDVSGVVLESRSGFSTAYALYNDTVYLPNGCYSVNVYDSYGDGLCCYGGGQGFFAVNNIDGNSIWAVRDFGAQFSINLTLDYINGVDELTKDAKIFTHPNPAHDQLRLNTSIENATGEISITDISGRIVYHDENLIINEHLADISLTGIAQGVYFLRLLADGKWMSGKFVVE